MPEYVQRKELICILYPLSFIH